MENKALSLDLPVNNADTCSFSNLDEVIQTHISLKLSIDFTTQIITGVAMINFKAIKNTMRVVLDCKSVNVVAVRSNENTLKYVIQKEHRLKGPLGTPLIVTLNNELKENEEVKIEIFFNTTDKADAIQWIEKDQTPSKKEKLLYLQCQAALCRTFFPCQDSPGVKVTVDAEVSVPGHVTCLFGGICIGSSPDENDKNRTIYRFEQKIPIPTYLIIVAAGDLANKAISDRCSIWTDPLLLEAAHKEFEDTERFLQTAEDYVDFKYNWGRYDILVLPNAFPYGGMENPCLTFVSASLIVGDKSLASVIAHEISHSWTGNGVTNVDWGNFWVNEGFTVFLERKIIEILYGEDMMLLHAKVGAGGLSAAIKSFGESDNYTKLHPDFSEVDPDDGFSVIPYEKGFLLLYHLQTLLGKELFRDIFRLYIKAYFGKSVSYLAYKNIFEEQVKLRLGEDRAQEIFQKVNWDELLFSTGYFPLTKEYPFNTSLVDKAVALANNALCGDFNPEILEVYKAWSAKEKMVFLNHILDSIRVDKNNKFMKVLPSFVTLLDLNSCNNPEVAYIWFQIVLEMKSIEAVEHIDAFLGRNGRVRYLCPLYKGLVELDKSKATEIFNKHKCKYHPVAARVVEGMLK